jgi:hypothetical protein
MFTSRLGWFIAVSLTAIGCSSSSTPSNTPADSGTRDGGGGSHADARADAPESADAAKDGGQPHTRDGGGDADNGRDADGTEAGPCVAEQDCPGASCTTSADCADGGTCAYAIGNACATEGRCYPASADCQTHSRPSASALVRRSRHLAAIQ